MPNVMREIKVLADIYDEESPRINLHHLASFFNVTNKDLANALKMDPTIFSRNPLTAPKGAIKQWLLIFNMIIKVIDEAEPGLPPEQVKINMQKWLHLPRPELENNSPLECMFKGKSRKVKMLLEQLLA